jgi:glycosyltransferase involved in cell wall biosynthesis
MRVAGFTFIRNALKFDYPIVEAITSILPVCDEFIVAVGNSDDGTRSLIEKINSPKIRIIDTIWNDNLREGGKVLADETNKAFHAISAACDWAFYIQGDEVIHEQYLPEIIAAMSRWKDDRRVEGLLLNYVHFYGSYDYIGDSRKWYRREVRIVRNDPRVTSFRDAQGFRFNERLIRIKPVDACVYHYGWVKPPEMQQNKQKYFNKLWHDDEWMDKHIAHVDQFDYSVIDSLARFEDTHPRVMIDRVKRKNWEFSFDPTRKNFSPLKRPGEYKNFRIVGD